ncbi:hypothetical protein [Cupriavidus sp. BIC8F]|uniref:DUF4376 domain-containing protein n=1 Tax=Cupriavidus sp. BIC8F TaxID=3079014 RepID=UPI002916C7AA|nr:hypothetical protein [Cupriavidus sp. BIC8F]
MGQKHAGYDAQGNIVAYYDSVDSPVPQGVNAIELTDAEWLACISTPGYKVQDGDLVEPLPPTAAQLVAAAKAAQIVSVTEACGAAIVAGFQSSALGAMRTYPSSLIDQQNLSASVLASLLPGLASGWVTPFWCADAAGLWSYADHTAAQIQQVGQDGKAAIVGAIQKKAELVAAIEAAVTIAAVQAITWSSP